MRCIAVGITVIVFGLMSAPVALAHDDVVDTSPSNGAQLTTAPDEVRIEFSPDASPRSGAASIAGPKGNTYQAGEARIDGTTLVVTSATPPATEATDSAPLWPWLIVAGAVGLGAVGLLRTISRSKYD